MNYNHLLYFWVVAREGTISRACQHLYVSQSTISGTLRSLEKSLGERLFTRSGRNLVLTDTGRLAFRYADEMFSLGRELSQTLRSRPSDKPLRLAVGVADSVPKLVAYRLLAPALALGERVHIDCREGAPDALLARLSVHALDLVIADGPVGPLVKIKAYNHLLGECGVTFFASRERARNLRRRFPRSLHATPLLLPSYASTLRRSLEQWFDAVGVQPVVAGEFDDSALLKVFGQAGLGAFTAPSVIESDVVKRYQVSIIGRVPQVQERFYAISVERKLKHPAVVAVTNAAREGLFG